MKQDAGRLGCRGSDGRLRSGGYEGGAEGSNQEKGTDAYSEGGRIDECAA
jgi:hypothetical protein